MNRTIVALFDSSADVVSARQDLLDAGFSANQIDLSEETAGTARTERHEGGFLASLREFFTGPDPDYYEEATRRGGTLLSLNTNDEHLDRAVDILQRHNPTDIDRRVEEWRQSGWRERERGDREERIPVVEEQLQIGKQRETRGGVRVYSRVTETPVEEDVRLREERVDVKRQKTDRPARAEDLREQTVEMTETREEPVVRKEARVVEEVILTKNIQERTEKVRDTVRRTDVEVEQLNREHRADYEQRFAGRGYAYDDVQNAYRYGEQLGSDPRYRDQHWKTVEPEARRAFEERNPGMWNEFKDAIQDAFERVRRTRQRKAA